MVRASCIGAASALALTTLSSIAAAEPASYTIQITGYVPVICNVGTSSTIAGISEGVADLGQVSEFCNNPTGYQVWVDHTPGVQSASFVVDGQSIPLSAGGSTMISSSATAAKQSRHVLLDLGSDSETVTQISLRIVPL